MKTVLYVLLISLLLSQNLYSQRSYEDRQQRTEWFRSARFGMFIHWGIYAIPARGEWIKTPEKISEENYQKYFDSFNPVDYNPKEWAKIAKNAGMKYVVLTAKHHDGFCLFDSKYTDYKATNTPAKRDLIKEYVEAFRAEGLKVGFYYSLIDWHHPDYPNVGNHPMSGNPEWDKKKYNWDNYLKYMHNQVEELLTNYGKIDIMWFDYSFGEYNGEKWKATELVKMVRKLQPGIIIDNRLGGNMEKENPEIWAGDFEGPEHIFDKSIGQYYLKDLKGKVKSATLLRDGSEVHLADFWNGTNKPFVAKDEMKSISLVSSGLLGCLTLCATAKNFSAKALTKPNVLIVVIDDMGWKQLGCYGSNFYKTPNIDSFAHQGVRFI